MLVTVFLVPEEGQNSQAVCLTGLAAHSASVDEKKESPAAEESEREKTTPGSSDHPECLDWV